MPELDPFERGLETALRAFADGGVIPVDAAEFTARVAGRPRRMAWPRRPELRLAWVLLLLAALLLALLAGSLLVGSRITESRPRHPVALVPTGVDVLALGSSTFGGAAADATGAVWASIGGALARIDPASGAVRTWTVADDAAFGNIDIVPARGGGVWLVPTANGVDQALRWFDGERFRDVVPAPPSGPGALAEAPDGSLWSGAVTGLFRWDGTSWSAAPEGRPVAGVSALAVDRSGAVWVGNCDDNAGGGARNAGSRGSMARAGRRSRTWPRRVGSARLPTAPSGSTAAGTSCAATGTSGHIRAPSGRCSPGGSPGQRTGPHGCGIAPTCRAVRS